MKKSVLFGLAVLAFGGTAVAQEVQYVPDCSQGLLINKNTSNWFITLEGGANMLFGEGDHHAAIKNRIDGSAAVYVGKWVTPTFGFRFGGNYKMTKGATKLGEEDYWARKWNVPDGHYVSKDGKIQEGWYEQKWQGFGPEFDVMVNLTNWWCGYRPGRVYNAVVHGGAGAYWRWYETKNAKWHPAKNTIMFATLGLQNNFRLSKHVDFFIDLQYQIIDDPTLDMAADVYLGFNFNLGQTDWNCPVTAVCPTWKYTDAEGDAMVQTIEAQGREINKLKRDLEECLKNQKPAPRPNSQVSQKVMECKKLVTVYFPINQYSLSQREQIVLRSVAEVMKENPAEVYELIGWADTYTGNVDINNALRENRVNTVKNFLMNCGVSESQLNAVPSGPNDNLYEEFGVEAAPIDRAVTINLGVAD